ncbi:hypothetical protein DXT76_13490 [Halobacillus trueperi]|uniref:Uncharacterized protein n=1 Tax=Halobacillus trueperi TaxID=156205 RepID=A0A3D8VLW7_9BACI|nr:hypothetical protein [Halobacillus trueperi]RDY70283.1 hypothetical protein DXT76_13490 [Halobacillus trueperi]
MDYSEVNKIEVLDSVEEVNKKLDRYWTLLAVQTVTESNQTKLSFVVGWTHSEDEETYVRQRSRHKDAF